MHMLQFVKYDESALEQCVTVPGRLDTLRTAIKKSHPEPVLEIGDDLRHGGRGNSELRRGFGHAAALGHGGEHVQVPQPQPAADLAVPVDLS